MTPDEYVPSDEDFIDSWACAHVTPHDMTAEEAKDAARAFLARVRRDAAREALDGLAAEEEDSFLSLHVKDAPIAAAQCTHAAITAREYRDTHYPIPEETP